MRTIYSIVAACCFAVLYGCGASSVAPGLPNSHSAGMLRPHASTSTFKTLYSFAKQANGAGPRGELVRFHGLFYGATAGGGSSRQICDCGAVFSLDGSGNEHVVHAFLGINYQKGTSDGAVPQGSLTEFKGRLYGTTSTGGVTNSSLDCATETTYGCGTVYSIDAKNREHVVYSFQGAGNGDSPLGELVPFDGKLYGVTGGGGDCEDCGIVFSITPSGTEKVVHRFIGIDGELPQAGLSVIAGKLYGTTFAGGTCCGTVFSIDSKNRFSTVYSFTNQTDGYPISTIAQIGNTMYGTTYGDGSGCGTIFSLTAKGSERTVYTFCGSQADGKVPEGDLAVIDNVLYGTTILGGAGCQFGRGCGTIFAFDPTTGQEKVAHVFLSSEGSKPNGVSAIGGTLYGNTFDGGGPGKQRGNGTVYAFHP
jgi:uncharacterized repeat protein (TIGR03803 family)